MRRILPLSASLLLVLSVAGSPAFAQQGNLILVPKRGAAQEAVPGAAVGPTAGQGAAGAQGLPQQAIPGGDTPQAGETAGAADEGNPNEAEQLGLTSPEVRESQPPGPDETGMRAEQKPDPGPEAPTITLYDALVAVRRAPPALDGSPVQRPNPLASEPTLEMEPHPETLSISLFPEGYVE